VKHEKNIVSDPDYTVDVECVPNAYTLCACAAGHGHLAPDRSSSDKNGRAAKSNRRADDCSHADDCAFANGDVHCYYAHCNCDYIRHAHIDTDRDSADTDHDCGLKQS